MVWSCGGNCPDAQAPAPACAKNAIPVGRWTGDWESYPRDNPNFVRSGTIDVVIAEGGRMTGHTVEEDDLDRGTISGAVRQTGEFEAQYDVSRDSQARKYAMKGSFVCEPNGIGGLGIVTWAEQQQGNLKFSLHRAP